VITGIVAETLLCDCCSTFIRLEMRLAAVFCLFNWLKGQLCRVGFVSFFRVRTNWKEKRAPGVGSFHLLCCIDT
jgi:hypothetical protein